jgi:hypothetical protein
MARAALALVALVVVAASAVSLQEPPSALELVINRSTDRMAKAVLHKAIVSGGSINYAPGEATIVGYNLTDDINVYAQTGALYNVPSALLSDGFSQALVLTSGPASNIVTGNSDSFLTAYGDDEPPNPVDPYLSIITTSTAWMNGVSLVVPVNITVDESAAIVQFTYTFCTSRDLASQSSSALDGVFIVIGEKADTMVGTTDVNVATFQKRNPSDPLPLDMVVQYRFSDPSQGVLGTALGLPAKVTQCLKATTVPFTATVSGAYVIRIIASSNNYPNPFSQAYLIMSAGTPVSLQQGKKTRRL